MKPQVCDFNTLKAMSPWEPRDNSPWVREEGALHRPMGIVQHRHLHAVDKVTWRYKRAQ